MITTEYKVTTAQATAKAQLEYLQAQNAFESACKAFSDSTEKERFRRARAQATAKRRTAQAQRKSATTPEQKRKARAKTTAQATANRAQARAKAQTTAQAQATVDAQARAQAQYNRKLERVAQARAQARAQADARAQAQAEKARERAQAANTANRAQLDARAQAEQARIDAQRNALAMDRKRKAKEKELSERAKINCNGGPLQKLINGTITGKELYTLRIENARKANKDTTTISAEQANKDASGAKKLAKFVADYQHKKLYTTVKGKEKERRTRKHIETYIVKQSDNNPLTDTGIAYLQRAVEKLTYTAIKSIYTRTGNPYIYSLMADCADYFNDNLIDEYRQIITINPHGLKGKALIEWKKHTKKKINGQMMKVPAYYTKETTETGKEYIATAQKNKNDFADCVSVAMVKAIEMLDNGLLVDYDSIYCLRVHIFRAVNAYIMNNRRIREQNENFHKYCIFEESDESGNRIEVMYTGKDVDKRLLECDVESLLETVKSIIEKAECNKRINKEMLYTVASLYDLTNVSIATLLGIGEKQVRRYKNYITDIVTSKKEYIDLLHDNI